MSLINDALQRAKRLHQNAAPAAGSNLRFQPADSSQRPSKKLGLVLPATAATILVIGIVSLVLSNRKAVPPGASRTGIAGMPAADVSSLPATVRARGQAAPVTPRAPLAATSKLQNSTNQASAAEATGASAQPAPPKLQAIVFNPTRPSAIVSGKTVVVGDRVNEFRVAAIHPDHITLVSESETNVLRME